MSSWTIIITCIPVALALFAAYLEYRRVNKAWLLFRLIAVLIAAGTFACLVLPVGFYSSRALNKGNTVLLLTKGFNKDSLEGYASAPIFTLDSGIHQTYPKAKLISAIDDAITDSLNKPSIHVFGYGLDDNHLLQLSNQIIFHPAPLPDGVLAADWTKDLSAGEKLIVQGTYENPTQQPLKLLLRGLSTTLDSTYISAGKTTAFSLSAAPKHLGHTVFELVAVSGNDTIENEQLPVTITPAKPLRVLMLSAAPGFEEKFLKDWLSNNGYAVGSRAVISKGKISQTLANMNGVDLSHISAAILEKFDVMVADAETLITLSPDETVILRQQIDTKGIGLIIRTDSSDKATSWFNHNFATTTIKAKTSASSLQLGSGATTKLIIGNLRLKLQGNTQPLITDVHGVMSAAALSGAGKLVGTTISTSYQWMLSGNELDYAAVWSALISKAARKAPAATNWWVESNLPVVAQPVKLVYQSTDAPDMVTINDVAVAPQQNGTLPFEHEFIYWPQSPGWQIAKNNASAFWWFAWRKDSWPGIRAAQNMALTKRYVSTHNRQSSVTKQIQQNTFEAVPKIYFYILFLIAAAFLWAEKKYAGN